jgi:hypothetical protein
MSAAALFPAAAASGRGRIPPLDIGRLFLEPDCVPTCVGPDNPPRYAPTTFGAFAQRLLTLNFAHRLGDRSEEYA